MKNRYIIFFGSVLFDMLAAVVSFFLALAIGGIAYYDCGRQLFYFTIPVWAGLLVLSFYFFRIYSILWRFSSFSELLRIFVATAVASAAAFISQMAVFNRSYDLDVNLVTFFFTCALTVISRLCMKSIIIRYNEKTSNKQEIPSELNGNIMIIGGGSAGSMIINELSKNSPVPNSRIKCVIDDDPAKKGTYISGIHIVGGRDMIIEAAEKYRVDTILFAIPSCNNTQKFEILTICQQTGCTLKIIPSIYQMIDPRPSGLSSKIRKVEIEDLLGREPIKLDVNRIINYVAGKTVLVTGGGGTIGSCAVRLQSIRPKSLLFLIFTKIMFTIFKTSLNAPTLSLI